ncbi:MAG: 1-phosphofructokinase [Ruminococcaceae bacterium]|nr:1-phosphofructokinase [Oscillospiraceae bacterium]
MNPKVITVTLNPCIDKTLELAAFSEGGLNRVLSVRTDAGGKGINVAKALRNFGVSVLATGIMGSRGNDAFVRELDWRAIPHDFTQVEGDMRTNYKLFNQAKSEITEVNEPGLFLGEDDYALWKEKLHTLLPGAQVLVLSGSIPQGSSSDMYQELTHIAHAYGVKTILDADGPRLKAGIEAVPYAIKPNLFELEQLCGYSLKNEEDMIAYCRMLISKGIELIILSMGEKGALYITADTVLRTPAPQIICKGTVGAGDSMVAATAYGLVTNMPIEQLTRFATAAGSATAACPGTEICSIEQVRTLMEEVDLVPLYMAK